MRDMHYKSRNIRMSDEVWEKLMFYRKDSGLSWNQFIKKLIEVYTTV